MKQSLTRREMLKTTGLAGAGVWLGTSPRLRRPLPPGEKLGVAVVGIGGQGRGNLNAVAKSEEIVALCDVDEQRAGDAFDKYPKAKRFRDYRRMLDEMDGDIDAVIVSTPDHTHFHPAYEALRRGKHLYCEKPMAHNVWEVRALTETARKNGLATQLGVQRHVHGNVHRVVELVRGGVIGEVSECQAWVGGVRGMPEPPKDPDGFPPVPAHLDWDLWMGPTAARRYSPAYCPYHWRFWWDYGTGEMGNWGCHILDIPFWALELTHPTNVSAEGPPVDEQRTPKSMTTHLEFPAHGERPAVTLHWSHTKEGPPLLREHGLPHKGSGVLFVGTKGMLLCDFGSRSLHPADDFAELEPPKPWIPDSPGFHREWILACKGGEPATCHFDYSGPLTEAVLLANVAYRCGEGFAWNTSRLEASSKKAQALIREEYRKGWEV